MKLAVVVQRYGADINGGAELHARFVAERLARYADVDVLTTCARDYVTWRNEIPAGTERVNGISVLRFPVNHARSPKTFARWSDRVFRCPHSLAEELAWLDSEGPASGRLLRHLAASYAAYDYFIFFSYRYYHAFHGVRAVASKALLVPTAERDPAIGLSLFGPIFRGVRAIMYNSHEERAMIQAVAQNANVPGVVVGVGSEVPARTSAERFRSRHDVRTPFALYVGRIDENKGCKELFEFFQRFAATRSTDLALVLIGGSVMPLPAHPRIRHLGYLPDEDKFDALTAANVLIMPSFFESLSMVAIEAWALGRPVLANARCDVLCGQCIRSNAGLYYENYEEFAEALRSLETDNALSQALGENGRGFFERNYAWPVIEGKYIEMFDRLQAEDRAGHRPPDPWPWPGWLARRNRSLPAASEVMERLPRGPVVGAQDA